MRWGHTRGMLTPCPARVRAEGAAAADRWLTRTSGQLAQELGWQDRSPSGGATNPGAGGAASGPSARGGGGAEPLNPGAPGGGGRGRAGGRDAAGGAEAAAAPARAAADAQRRRAEDEVEDALRAMKERLGRRG